MPGSATPGSAGTVTSYAPVPVRWNVSGTRRWSLSVEWVAAPARTSANEVTTESVVTSSFAPLAARAGDAAADHGPGLLGTVAPPPALCHGADDRTDAWGPGPHGMTTGKHVGPCSSQ